MHGSTPTAVAFYLPQFHPIPENDRWWSPGFTEWTNVAQARPLFRGHYQPHIPADLGFYDLRLAETRNAQAALAARYGIGAFCYYHYWFEGRRVLERPFNEVLASGEPDFPFCLCWANEDWTRAWDGTSREVLLEQRYSVEDDVEHFHALLPAFLDRRYLRHEGKPVFLIYRAGRLPHVEETMRRWDDLAKQNGLPGLHLLRVESFPDEHGDPRALGFSAAVEFQPDWRSLPDVRWKRGIRKACQRFGRPVPKSLRHTILQYEEIVKHALDEPPAGYPKYGCVAPSWDNTPRRKEGGLVLKGSRPELYGHWLRQVARRGNPFVFINAWNEWAEGCHLEPCRKWGHSYLQATRLALSTSSPGPKHPTTTLAGQQSDQVSEV